MRGGTQAHLVSADDGSAYVVKSPQNPQGQRVLVNEWLVAKILDYLRLPTPVARPLRISRELLDRSPEIAFHSCKGELRWAPCVALGSRFPGSVSSTAVYDFLPTRLLLDVVNVSQFAGMLAVDKWVSNADFRQAIFVRERLGARTDTFGGASNAKRLFAQFVDQGLAFQGSKWEFRDAPLAGRFRDLAVYRQVRGLGDFSPYLEGIEQFPADQLERIAASVPREWLDKGDAEQLGDLCHHLMNRRRRVRDLILETRKTAPDTFPAWT